MKTKEELAKNWSYVTSIDDDCNRVSFLAGYSAAEEKFQKLVEALKGLQYGDPKCFCGVAIGHPLLNDHSPKCKKALETLEDFYRGEGEKG